MDAAVKEAEGESATRALELLGDGTRLATLRAVAAAEGPVSFSALRRTVGVDDSGRFNYHLRRLTGVYVERNEAGYTLLPAGRDALAAVAMLGAVAPGE
jgi:DNA-binding HxlR family transcriptional regulator